MSLQYIIDGYNIIHHPIFIRQADRKTKDTRLALLNLIKTKALGGSLNNKVTVVFDGYPPAQKPQGFNNLPSCIDIVFSRTISADEKIKIMVERSANRRNIVVVSDDKEIRFIVRSLGARQMSVEEFAAPRQKTQGNAQKEALEEELSYSHAEKINRELRKLWLEKP